MHGYRTPEEGAAADTSTTDRWLGAILGKLYQQLQAKELVSLKLLRTDDEDEIDQLEYELKLIRSIESSLHRLESGLQSRLSAGRYGA